MRNWSAFAWRHAPRLAFARDEATRSALFVLMGLVVLFGVLSPNHAFLKPSNLLNITSDASSVGIIVVGMTLVLVSAGIDLSVGSVLVLGSVVAGKTMGILAGAPEAVVVAQNLYPNAVIAIPVGLSLGLIAGVLAGVVNGILVAYTKVPPFIVTLGMLGVALGSASMLTGGIDVYTVPQVLQDIVTGQIFGLPILTAIALVFVVIGHFLLSTTRFGRYLYAIGSGHEVARRAGIKVERYLIAAYIICGFLAAVTGLLDMARFRNAALGGYSLVNLDAVSAAVIGGVSLFGGRGTIPGAVIGSLIAAVLLNGFVVMGFGAFWQQVVIGVMIVVAVLVDQLRRGRSDG